MDAPVQRRLLEINRAFYDRFARQFADSRSTSQASLRRVLATIGDGAAVLDVGCGDGRVACALDEMSRRAGYVGVDASEPFVVLAQARAAGLAHVATSFCLADVTQAGWRSALARQSFDIVLALAVLHHIPGGDVRQRVVDDMAALLAPRGRLVISTWQFLGSDRLRKKIVPWAAAGLEAGQVDEGDYLLNWERGGYGLRYCRMIGEDELRGVCENAGLKMTDVFVADNGLNLYVTAQHANV